jgi:endoribonuclease LACTB2
VQDILETTGIGGANVWKFPRSDVDNDLKTDYNGLHIQALKNKQLFKIEGATLQIVHTPGHTTDHVVMVLEEENAVFSGDCILGEGTAVFENLYDYMKSLVLIRNLQPSKIYPGHGNVVKSPKEIIDHYIAHRNKREQQIVDLLSLHADCSFEIMDIVKEMYQNVPSELWPAAAFNVSHHLQKLKQENKVEEVEQNDSMCYRIHQSHKL